MPNKTIYIRKNDLVKWEAIKNKPEWLHERLISVVIKRHPEDTAGNDMWPEVPKCKCGDYHFSNDPNYKKCLEVKK